MSKVRFGIIGLGGIGKERCGTISETETAELAVVCSGSVATACEIAKQYRCDYTGDYAQLLERADVDAVAIYTPTGTHESIALAAAEAGKHVLLTKPLATTLLAAESIVRGCEKASVRLGLEYTYRYAPDTAMVRELIAKGRLGKIVHSEYGMYCQRSEAYYTSNGGWRARWDASGGGAVMHQGIHAIDQMLWLQGMPISVVAMTETLGHRLELEDVGVALFQFRDSTFASLVASTVAIDVGAATDSYGGTCLRSVLYGLTGTVALENGRIVGFATVNGDKVESRPVDGTYSGIEDFSELVGTGRLTSERLQIGADCLDAVRVVDAVYKSARIGGKVMLTT